ncbi:MAG: hypothetical protein AB7V13_01890 [Pseudorhodoplanes sp.]|uniref:hypothetical protein n=1 Tax=Pseudorhodoplanes sp. TaxID=1934341 RepID=UPI003D0E3995
MKKIAIALLMTVSFAASAYAAAPASCASKLVGVWSHQNGFTTVYPNGVAVAVWPYRWTCKGNHYTFTSPSGMSWTQRLSRNGKYLIGPPFNSARVR